MGADRRRRTHDVATANANTAVLDSAAVAPAVPKFPTEPAHRTAIPTPSRLQNSTVHRIAPHWSGDRVSWGGGGITQVLLAGVQPGQQLTLSSARPYPTQQLMAPVSHYSNAENKQQDCGGKRRGLSLHACD